MVKNSEGIFHPNKYCIILCMHKDWEPEPQAKIVPSKASRREEKNERVSFPLGFRFPARLSNFEPCALKRK